MARRRMPRSKTGCQVCRRRKVRCDETKPSCQACARLDLSCVYGSKSGDATRETSKHRLRFISSSYSSCILESGTSSGVQLSTTSARRSDPPTRAERPETAGELSSLTPIASIAATNTGYAEHITREIISDQQDAADCDVGALPATEMSSQAGLLNGSQYHQSQQALFLPQNPSTYCPHAEGYAGLMPMPAFFDLNMNFDSVSDDWTTISYPAQASMLTAAIYEQDENQSGSVESSEFTISPADHGLIQHYLNVMSQYTKLRGSGDENIYTQIFSNMALFYAPLYHAIMGWTAMHMGQSKRQAHIVSDAEERNSRAVLLLHQDRNIARHTESALVTIWFALQFELLAARGIDLFCQHLEFAADLIDTHRRQARLDKRPPALGPISSRVLLWLGSYDARASWVGGTGRFLQSLEMFMSEYNFLDVTLPDASEAKSTDMSELRSCLQSNLEIDIVDNRMALLHRRAVTAPSSVWSQVQSDLLSIQDRLKGQSLTAAALEAIIDTPSRAFMGKITTKLFNNMLLLSACYSLIIEFHRLIPASLVGNLDTNGLISGEVAANHIIRISAWVNRLRQPSPQNIWPRILFLAGIETIDLVYQDWVLRAFSDAERWGNNFTKTRALLDHIVQAQGNDGARIDYLDAMKQCTGLFII